jgi:putative FmdB family regulatory protein
MPVYEFVCEDCGPFEEQRTFAESGDPASCPECETEARRVYSMPSFTSLSKAQKELRRREERSGEPKLGVKPRPEGPPEKPKLQRSHGRPWEIGH